METSWKQDLKDFGVILVRYIGIKLLKLVWLLEKAKSAVAGGLYHQRGRYARPFIHSGMVLLVVGGVVFGPTLISETFPGLVGNPWQESTLPITVSAFSQAETATQESIKPRAEVLEYTVQPGDTVSTIADKFGIGVDTVRWENKLKSVKDIKPGQALRILPTTGVMHKVKPGETVYSIAKKYQVDAQAMVDWPYNSFANDETFELAVGQMLMVPEGIMPQEAPIVPRKYMAVVPGAGLGTGQFVWPTSGHMSQYYSWYHKGYDIANRSLPDIVAADGGTVIVAGWPAPWAYGNRVMVDHGNGYITLYGHMSQIYVTVGQKVAKGQAIGKMGSTGRSTGPHVHFEIRQAGGGMLNPGQFLK